MVAQAQEAIYRKAAAGIVEWLLPQVLTDWLM
jgi:hypothetical protein